MRTLFIFLLFGLSFSVYSQNTENKIIVVKQIGFHYKNFKTPERSSKKIYYFFPDGRIFKVLIYGRHHYAYLSVIGTIETYSYDNNLVFETDTIFPSESDDVYSVSVDTFDFAFFEQKHLYDTIYNVYDRDNKLIQSANEYSTVKKYQYKSNGLISEITFFFTDDENALLKSNKLIFKAKKQKRLSIDIIDRLNKFILWQHGLGI